LSERGSANGIAAAATIARAAVQRGSPRVECATFGFEDAFMRRRE
jgi:hypothetical protein